VGSVKLNLLRVLVITLISLQLKSLSEGSDKENHVEEDCEQGNEF
jgi:hypothetical protein